jgi:glycosyltransferase involved in cell wall biosynthesis
MKKISIVIPCYNEERNIVVLTDAIINHLEKNIPSYDYEIIFIDNHSTDSTRENIESLCQSDKKIKAIFNIRNFGQFNSPFYGICQTSGDCTILIGADFQDPVQMISKFVAEWENGHRIVVGVKTRSKESKVMYFLRSCYYKIIKKFADVEYIEHFTGFGLYDKSFIDIVKTLNDPLPFLRGIVAEFGEKIKEIPYRQQKRKFGKTKNNLYTLYDAAMLSITAYTKIGIRLASIIGFITATLSAIATAYYLIAKIVNWNSFSLGIAPLIIGGSFFFSIILIFIGLLGEYVLSIHARIMNRPLVIEEKRINF